MAVEGATRDQLYTTALGWFSESFNGEEIVRNKLAGTLIGMGVERYKPLPFRFFSCSGSIRYRVVFGAREGRYYYSIEGFTHESDPSCGKNSPSFGLLTEDQLSAQVTRAVILTLRPSGRDDGTETWADIKGKSTELAEKLAKALRARLGTTRNGAR